MEGTSNSLVNSVPSFISGLRILLVDHDTTSLMYTASMLEQYSYKVTTTELASIALSMIEKQNDRFQLVMANVNMPDMDSFTFLRRISDMPVILMSSKKDVNMAKKALSEGACFFLEKPISIEDLRYVWQHAYRKGILAVKETGKVGCEGNTANCEKESLGRKIQEVDIVSGIDTGNGLHGINQAHMIADPKGKNKQIDGKYGLIEGKGREMSQNIGTRGITIAESKEQGKRKRSNEDKNEKQKEKINETNSQQINSKSKNPMEKEGGEKKDDANSIAEKNLLPHLLWDSDLQLKFTSAINALREKVAQPKSIHTLTKVANLTHRQSSSHLQKYKGQVQRSSDTAEAFEANPSSFQSIVPKSTPSFNSRNEFPQSHGRPRSVLDRLQGTGTSDFGIEANRSQFNTPKHCSVLERLQGAGTSNTTQFNPPKRYSALDRLRRVGTSSDFGIGAANRTQFNSSISLASPGQYVKNSFRGNLTIPNHKPGFAGLSSNLLGNPHSYYGKNYNQAQMPNYRELHGLNQRREKRRFSNGINMNENGKEKQKFGLEGSIGQTSKVDMPGLSYMTQELASAINSEGMYPLSDAPPDARQELNPAVDLSAPSSSQNLDKDSMAFIGLPQEPDSVQGLISSGNPQNPNKFSTDLSGGNQDLDAILGMFSSSDPQNPNKSSTEFRIGEQELDALAGLNSSGDPQNSHKFPTDSTYGNQELGAIAPGLISSSNQTKFTAGGNQELGAISSGNPQNPNKFPTYFGNKEQEVDAVPRLAPPGYSVHQNQPHTENDDFMKAHKDLEELGDFYSDPNVDVDGYCEWLNETLLGNSWHPPQV